MPGTDGNLTFLSYAHDDLDKVRKVYEGLKKRGVNPWLDKNDMTKGKWKPQINQAIANSKYFIVCLSDIAISKMRASKGIQKDEFSYAYYLAMNLPEDALYILPVRLEDCDRGDHRFQMYQQYDLFPDLEKGLDKLAVDIGGVSLSDARARDERTEDEKMVSRLRNKAILFYMSRNKDKALSCFEAVTTIKPDYDEVWSNKGMILRELGRHKEAIQAYDKAIEIKPDSYEAWNNKGAVLNDLGRYEEALIAHKKTAEINPEDRDAWYNIAITLGKLDRHEEALEAFNKVLNCHEEALETNNERVIKINLSNDGDAYSKFKDFVSRVKTWVSISQIHNISRPELVWTGKGETLAALGRHDEALEAFNKALEIKRDSYKAWYNKGAALAALSRHDEALEAYNKAIEIKGNFYLAWANKGVVLADLGRHDEALEAYNKAIEIKPNSYEVWYNKGVNLGKLGRHDEMLQAYNKAIEIKPDSYEAWTVKGIVLSALGRGQEARQAFEKAEEIKGDSKKYGSHQ